MIKDSPFLPPFDFLLDRYHEEGVQCEDAVTRVPYHTSCGDNLFEERPRSKEDSEKKV